MKQFRPAGHRPTSSLKQNHIEEVICECCGTFENLNPKRDLIVQSQWVSA